MFIFFVMANFLCCIYVFTYLIMVLHKLQRNAEFVASVENDLILHYWKHQMYIM